MTKFTIISYDTIGKTMAGPGIRAAEMVRELCRQSDVEVSLVAPHIADNISFGDQVHVYPKLSFGLLFSSDLILFRQVKPIIALARLLRKRLIFDAYDPEVIEHIAFQERITFRYRVRVARVRLKTTLSLLLADKVLVASKSQQALYAGLLLAGRRRLAIKQSLFDTVPFGMPVGEPEKHDTRVLRGVVPGIEEDSFVMIWGGGIWNWFDPLTLIEAVSKLKRTYPHIRLFFLGIKHPDKNVPQMQMTQRAIALAQKLGLYGKEVIFHEGWVPYEQRADYLLESDLGVSTHFNNLETYFSFRTRLLDYMWTNLPMVITEGDTLADFVEKHQMGVTVRAGSVEDLSTVLAAMMDHQESLINYRMRIQQFKQRFAWPVVLQPIVAYALAPERIRSSMLSIVTTSVCYFSIILFHKLIGELKE